MKSIVKTITSIMIVVITFASAEFVNANTATADTLNQTITSSEAKAQSDKMEKALVYGLQSDVNGVLEATFFNIVSYKTLNPDFTSSTIEDRIAEIARGDAGSHVVRYKAMLTLSYLKDKESFDVADQILPLIKKNDANGTFEVLVDVIREQQFAESQNR